MNWVNFKYITAWLPIMCTLSDYINKRNSDEWFWEPVVKVINISTLSPSMY